MTDTPDQDYPIDNSEVPPPFGEREWAESVLDEVTKPADEGAEPKSEMSPKATIETRQRSMIERDIEAYIKPGPTPAYPNPNGRTMLEGIIRAWENKGNNPQYHEKMRRRVRTMMPELSRWLDKVAERGHIEVLFRNRLREFYPHYEEQLMRIVQLERQCAGLNHDLSYANNAVAREQAVVRSLTSDVRVARGAIKSEREHNLLLQRDQEELRQRFESVDDQVRGVNEALHIKEVENETLLQRLDQDGAQLQSILRENQEAGELLREMTARYEEAQHNYLSEQARANNNLEKSNEWQTEAQRKGRQLNSWKQKYDVMISDPRRMVQMGLEMLQRTHAANQASMVNNHFEAIKKHAEEMLALTDVSGMDRVLPEEGDTPGDEPSWREPEDKRETTNGFELDAATNDD